MREARLRAASYLVVSGAEPVIEQETEAARERRAVEAIQTLLADGMGVREIAAEVARLTGAASPGVSPRVDLIQRDSARKRLMAMRMGNPLLA